MGCRYRTHGLGGGFLSTLILDDHKGKINEDVRQSDYEIASFLGVSLRIPC